MSRRVLALRSTSSIAVSNRPPSPTRSLARNEPQLEAEALSEACGVPPLRLDHAARVGQLLLVLVGFHEMGGVDCG